MDKTRSINHTIRTQWFRKTIKLILDGQMGLLAWLIIFDLIPGTPFNIIDIAIWCTIVTACSAMFKITSQHYRMVGTDDLIKIFLASVSIFLISIFTHKIVGQISFEKMYLFLFLASLFTGIFWSTLRVASRSVYEGHLFLTFGQDSIDKSMVRTLVIGAGRAGFLAAEELKRHPELGSTVIGFVDDAFEKQGVRIQGVPVLGTTELLPMIIRENKITRVIIAIPSAPGLVIRKLSNIVRSAGVELKTVPGIYNLLGNQHWQPEIRDISIEDLLRRDPIHLDQTAMGRILRESVVLITGGGGSIGSELARQVAAYNPSRIVLLGRGEHSLWLIERELRIAFPCIPLGIELCDIRHRARLYQAFQRWKPQVVFHAAAHKHVPFLELYPEEAIENNVFGTKNVLDASIGTGTRIFVNISTDKSVNPTNVLGVSKYLAESLVRSCANRVVLGGHYVSVRFGNVLGSRGSVVPIFKDQILNGGPITITDSKMTRYFMTVPEASQLVLQAGLLGESGKVYILDMGDPVMILNLARDMITLSGLDPDQDIEIKFTGIRPGEKLFEELFNSHEIHKTRIHSKVFEATLDCQGTFPIETWLEELKQTLDIENETIRRSELLSQFLRLVPSYVPSVNGLGSHFESPRVVALVQGN